MLSHLHRLYAHLARADAGVLDGLRREPDDHPGARALFAHVLGAEHVWLQRLRQEPERVAVWPELTLEECAALAAENVAGLRGLLADLSEGDQATQSRDVSRLLFRGTTPEPDGRYCRPSVSS
ncbi:MAG TPA: hypothetical protein VEW03_00880, partial [Longimicrobiaceae bacterium]|nr:hypothetical protein [Longimicrobiaceae bacterium]